jgi:hypothetical protein
VIAAIALFMVGILAFSADRPVAGAILWLLALGACRIAAEIRADHEPCPICGRPDCLLNRAERWHRG